MAGRLTDLTAAVSPKTSTLDLADFEVKLSTDVGFGAVSLGSYVCAVVAVVASKYAARHPKLAQQTDVRSIASNFFRPVLPGHGVVHIRTSELNIGRGWSTLRVEVSQKTKLCVTTDIILTNFDTPGLTLGTNWKPRPPVPRPASFEAMEADADPAWLCHHVAFHPKGFRRGNAYAKTFLQRNYPEPISTVDAWLVPGWDCTPGGSRDPALPEARWTTELLPFLADANLPVQENFFPHQSDGSPPEYSAGIAATLIYADKQRQQRLAGIERWRDINNADGAVSFPVKMMNSSLTINIEIVKRLPVEGVRFLFARNHVKRVVNGRMDLESTILDENEDVVMTAHQACQMIQAATKNERTKSTL